MVEIACERSNASWAVSSLNTNARTSSKRCFGSGESARSIVSFSCFGTPRAYAASGTGRSPNLVVVVERHASGQKLERNDRKCELIAGGCWRKPFEYLGRHVAGVPKHTHSRDRLDIAKRLRDPKVREERVLVGFARVPDQDVLRLDVAMDDALGMDPIQRARYLADQSENTPILKLTLA